jgi:hypothetical protein
MVMCHAACPLPTPFFQQQYVLLLRTLTLQPLLHLGFLRVGRHSFLIDVRVRDCPFSYNYCSSFQCQIDELVLGCF